MKQIRSEVLLMAAQDDIVKAVENIILNGGVDEETYVAIVNTFGIGDRPSIRHCLNKSFREGSISINVDGFYKGKFSRLLITMQAMCCFYVTIVEPAFVAMLEMSYSDMFVDYVKVSIEFGQRRQPDHPSHPASR